MTGYQINLKNIKNDVLIKRIMKVYFFISKKFKIFLSGPDHYVSTNISRGYKV